MPLLPLSPLRRYVNIVIFMIDYITPIFLFYCLRRWLIDAAAFIDITSLFADADITDFSAIAAPYAASPLISFSHCCFRHYADIFAAASIFLSSLMFRHYAMMLPHWYTFQPWLMFIFDALTCRFHFAFFWLPPILPVWCRFALFSSPPFLSPFI